MTTKKLTRMALLTGIALIIFVIELQIPNPFPIPGVKLGLANIVTVYAVYRYSAGEAAMIVFCRIFLASIFGGNMMALAYSLSGSALCLSGMLLLKKAVDERHLWLSSVLGAVLHNSGQIAMAVMIVGRSALMYFPFLLVSGCLAGGFTGYCAQLLTGRLKETSRSNKLAKR